MSATTINYVELTDAVNPQFRTNAAKLADIMAALPPGKHKQDSWASPGKDENNHLCGTPHCALGWGVDRKLVDGVEIAVLMYLFDRTLADVRNLVPNAQFVDTLSGRSDGYIRLDTLSNKEYELLYQHDFNVGTQYAYPVLGKTMMDWEEVGNMAFGGAVQHAVFNQSTLTTKDVVERLRNYADNGYVDDDNYRYFIAPDDAADKLLSTHDRVDHEENVNGDTPHTVLFIYIPDAD